MSGKQFHKTTDASWTRRLVNGRGIFRAVSRYFTGYEIKTRNCLWCHNPVPLLTKKGILKRNKDFCDKYHRSNYLRDQNRIKPKAWRGKRRAGL